MSSIHHRGTPSIRASCWRWTGRTGAHCDGLGFRVEARYAAQTIDYLRERELISSAYLETRLAVTFRDCGTRHEDVLTYVIDPAHEQYRGDLSLEAQARIIASATGGRGPNDEYLYNTAAHLAELGLADSRSRLVGGAGASADARAG
jgi:cation transport protein ChaC